MLHAMMRELPDIERIGEIIEICQLVGNLEFSGVFGHLNTTKAYLLVDGKRHWYIVFAGVPPVPRFHDGGRHEQRGSIAQSPHLLRLVRRIGRVRRDLCRLRLRLYVLSLRRTAAAGFRGLARLGVAGVLARRLSLFRSRDRQRPARRSLRLPPPRRHRHDPDRAWPCRRKFCAQSARGLRLTDWASDLASAAPM